MLWTLAISALGSAAGAVVFLFVSSVLWRRPAKAASRGATRAFAIYWATTGGFLALTAIQNALAAFGLTPMAFFVPARYLGLGLASAGIAALVYYFAYLRTGERAWLPRIAIMYALVCAFAWWHTYASGPDGVAVARWSTDLSYSGDIHGALYIPLLVALLVVPIAGAGWYLTLLRKLEDPRQRYRILVAALGIGLQLTGVLLARISEADLFQFVARPLAGVVVALFVLSAYVERQPSQPKSRSTRSL